MLAERGEVAVSLGELNDLRALAANGADTAELAQETANLITLLHQARTSNAQVRNIVWPCCRRASIIHAKLTNACGWLLDKYATQAVLDCTSPVHSDMILYCWQKVALACLAQLSFSMHMSQQIPACVATERARQIAIQAEPIQEDPL